MRVLNINEISLISGGDGGNTPSPLYFSDPFIAGMRGDDPSKLYKEMSIFGCVFFGALGAVGFGVLTSSTEGALGGGILGALFGVGSGIIYTFYEYSMGRNYIQAMKMINHA